MSGLVTADVVRQYIDPSFDPRSPVRVLRWEGGDRLWELPDGLCITGAGPGRLGFSVRRSGGGYCVRLLWDRTLLSWPELSRVEILGSCLGTLLGAVGLDLWSMLNQPAPKTQLRAA